MGDMAEYEVGKDELKLSFMGANGGLTEEEKENWYENFFMLSNVLGINTRSEHFYPVKTKGDLTLYEFSGEIE